ncbi:protein O-mannose kinase-like [Palaemon carinicauda]|uniref:protein O-mannose kinase-like n=1 Tax=Palaemon carinicauda TaxID=392227 RepID=UPI0035B64809
MLAKQEYAYLTLVVLVVLLCNILPLSLCSFTNCDKGFFKIGNMTDCHPWLTCKEIRNVSIGDLIGYGAVKQVYKAHWGNELVSFNAINNIEYLNDFRDGLENLKILSPSNFIVQLVGSCLEEHVFLTEYYPLGDILKALSSLQEMLSLKDKFLFCIRYVEVLVFLHGSPAGKRVMCDSSTLNKTLEQYLVTASLNLVLNDADALPEVGKEGIVCGHKELYGSFIAPEQKWPFSKEEFEEKKMIPYDEKSDIWKISDVCNYFLGNSEESKAFKYHLYPIHLKCRCKTPNLRPTASEVLEFYNEVFYTYFLVTKKFTKEDL